MSWRVEVQRAAEKELRRVSPEVRERIASALRLLRENPSPPGVKKLTAADAYRIRVGDYRILYTVDAGQSVIRISAVSHRRQVYR